MANEQELLTVEEAAKKLSVSKRTVWRLIKRGEIRVRRFGGTVRIPWPQ